MSTKHFDSFNIVGQVGHRLEVSTPWYHKDGTLLTVYIWQSKEDGYWKASDLACAMQEYHTRHGEPPTDNHFQVIEKTQYPGATISLKSGCIVATSDKAISSISAVCMAVVRFDALEDFIEISEGDS